MFTKIAIASLCVLIGALGYFRVTDSKDVQKEIDANPHLCPNATQKIKQPPPIGPDAVVGQEHVMFASVISEADKALPIVTTAREVYVY